MKKILAMMMISALAVSSLAACGGNSSTTTTTDAAADTTTAAAGTTASADTTAAGNTATAATTGDFDASQPIEVFSREDGSGTRGAFIELVGVETKDDAGNKTDNTTVEAVITNSTSVMMTSVAGSEYAIGYVSMGSMNDTLKALTIDGAVATAENVANGTYKIARPFNIVTGASLSDVAQDFVNYIMSDDGQAIIEDNHYIKVDSTGAFTSNGASGKIVVAGSSSVSPVMEKLAEAYMAVNTGADIEIQTSDSTTGVTSAIDGICDIGMASRDLKDTETEKGVTGTTIAMDGIAVVVNNDNPLDEMTAEQVRQIFTGEVTTWDEIIK